jgi:hypothetical protein
MALADFRTARPESYEHDIRRRIMMMDTELEIRSLR